MLLESPLNHDWILLRLDKSLVNPEETNQRQTDAFEKSQELAISE